jgi:hypothetical protein
MLQFASLAQTNSISNSFENGYFEGRSGVFTWAVV